MAQSRDERETTRASGEHSIARGSSEGNASADAKERIARRAYELYERRGGEPGHDQEDWFTAEEELRGKTGE